MYQNIDYSFFNNNFRTTEHSTSSLFGIYVSTRTTEASAPLLTVDLQYMFGSGSAVKLVRVLGDDHHGSALLTETSLTLGYSSVGLAGRGLEGQFPPVVVELPHSGRVAGELLRIGQILENRKNERRKCYMRDGRQH